MIIVKNFYPHMKDDKRAFLLLDLLRNGSIYEVHGVTAMTETHVAFEKERFKAWKILHGLNMDDHDGNFETVEILRKVEGLEEFEIRCVSEQEHYLEES